MFEVRESRLEMDNNFYSNIGKLGGKATRENALKRYYENPSYCKYCGQIINVRENEIPSHAKGRNFCDRKCFSEYQKKHMKNNSNRKIYYNTCLFCGKEVSGNKKFCNHLHQNQYEYESYIKRWKSGNENGMKGKTQVSAYIIRYLREKYNNSCSVCGWNMINPYTGNVPLECHHKDGNHKNNREENLSLLCPNCHSLTSTYKGANIGYGRESRIK